MPTPPSNANPEFSETQTPLYDNAGHQFVAMRAYNVGTDGTTNIVYGDPATGAGGGGGGAVTVADGADVTQGTTTDAAVVGDTAGSVSGKLRGLTKIWNDIWDSVNHRIKVDGSGVTQPVSGTFWQATQPVSGTVSVQHGNVISTNNSSTTLLTANSVFTGTSESAMVYSAISVEVFADQASAASGLSIQQSQNGTNWDTVDTFTVAANTAFSTIVNLVGQSFRIVYTNGGTNQGTFRLQVIKQAAETVAPRTLSALGNQKVAVQEALPAGSAVIGSATIQAASGTALVADQSNTELRASLYGKNAAAGDTALQLNSDGSQYMDMRRIAGTTLSNTNPFVTESNIQNWIRNGQGFLYGTAWRTVTSGYQGFSIFNPSGSGKTIVIYRIAGGYTVTAFSALFQLYKQTTDPAFANTITPGNLNFTSATASAANVTQTNTNATATAAGTKIADVNFTVGVFGELLANNAVITLPAGSGLTVYINATNTTQYAVDVYGVEF